MSPARPATAGPVAGRATGRDLIMDQRRAVFDLAAGWCPGCAARACLRHLAGKIDFSVPAG